MSSETLFTKIISGEIPSEKVYEDDEFYAFQDINPAAPVHVLLVPKKVIPAIADATAEDEGLLGRFILTANKIAKELGIAEAGFRYVINNGEQGGQTVAHLHLHILGGRSLEWPPG
ncbi:MAG: histidine triad nucleotide-binding protein [Candidatus Hydrogenedens sp.]|jgi:histidine triad (HIT) family protein|nr:histidine triad nucleotide-binding protein [Candidatus Hydrogenedens sp.]